MSFSHFGGGIKTVIPSTTIDFNQLTQLIISNPYKSLIEWIRILRKENNLEYKELKKGLPFITPNCVVHERKLADDYFTQNFNQFSGYIYIDIDGIPNPQEYKEYFIKKYGQLVSMVCYSSSMGGLSVLFKVSNTITKDNFNPIRISIINTYLKDELKYIDTNCSDIGRIWFISYDIDVFVNLLYQITVPVSDITSSRSEKRVNQSITIVKGINRLVYTFSELPVYNEFIRKVRTRTYVDVVNPIVDYHPIEYVEISFPNPIKNNSKHKVYTLMIHKLVYLNPTLDIKYLLSYVNFINNQFATPPMEFRELVRLFVHIIDITKNEGYRFEHIKVKNFHLNPDAKIDRDIKKNICNVLNGKMTVNTSINKIQQAKEQLQQEGKKITQVEVARVCGLSLKTVKNHYKKTPVDIEELVEIFNDSITPTRPTGIRFKDRLDWEGTDTKEGEYIHPECPQWVLEYEF